MTDPLPPWGPPVADMDEALVRMQAIDRALPATDGFACFNRMYLEATRDIQTEIDNGFFSDTAFLSTFDVVLANLYFEAVNALATPPLPIPGAWQPLVASRSQPGIYPIQFALAGMNALINHDLPLALVRTCAQLNTAPCDGAHHEDYQRVDAILDSAEMRVRESFESSEALRTDRDAQAVLELVDNWNINTARDVAWDTALALWECREEPNVEELIMNGLGRTVSMASRCLLVPLERGLEPEPEPERDRERDRDRERELESEPEPTHATAGLSICSILGRFWRAAEILIRG